MAGSEIERRLRIADDAEAIGDNALARLMRASVSGAATAAAARRDGGNDDDGEGTAAAAVVDTTARAATSQYPPPTLMNVVYRKHTEPAPVLHTVAVHHMVASYGSQMVQWRPFDPKPWVERQEEARRRANAPDATDADQDAWGGRWATDAGPVMGTAACAQQRLGCITGTEAATLAGGNPWAARDAGADGFTDTREWLLARKTGATPADKPRNAAMKRGNDEEQEAADLFEAVTGIELLHVNVGFIKDADGLVGASPDRLCRWLRMCTEIKSKGSHFAFIPETNYWWQMQQQMYVLGIEWNVYTQYISSGSYGGVRMPQICFHLIPFNAAAFDDFLRNRVAPFMLDLSRRLNVAPPEAAVRLAASGAAPAAGAPAFAGFAPAPRSQYTRVRAPTAAAAAAAAAPGRVFNRDSPMDDFATAFAAATSRPSVAVGAPAQQFVWQQQQQPRVGTVARPPLHPGAPASRARPAWAKARAGQSAAAKRIAAAAMAAATSGAGVSIEAAAAAAAAASKAPQKKKRAPAGSAYVGLPAGTRFDGVTPVRRAASTGAPRRKRSDDASAVVAPLASRSVPKTEAAAKRRRTTDERRAAEQRLAAGVATMQAAMMLLAPEPEPAPKPRTAKKAPARKRTGASAAWAL